MFYTSSVWGLDQNEKNDWGKIRDMGQINGSFSETIPAKKNPMDQILAVQRSPKPISAMSQ